MKPLNIAIAGLGTVGSATIDILEKDAALIDIRTGRPCVITAVSARDANKKRDVDISRYRFEKDPLALARPCHLANGMAFARAVAVRHLPAPPSCDANAHALG